jgi:signal transduction histidine kinase
MNRMWATARAYGLDVLIVAAAAAAAVEVAVADDPLRQPETALWFAVPAVAILVLPLLGRRRFPFAAPAAVWILAAGLSFADGRIVPTAAGLSIAGFAAAFLLGYLRDPGQARLGLAIVLGGGAIVAYNNPSHDPGDVFFTPLLFALGWFAGFAMRGRSEEAEAAEVRAAQAERERETAARIAVAEERARIARELHDIVAHAVSVMVLQVGAVRHRLDDGRPEDREALDGVERTGRTALTEMRRLLGAMRSDGEDAALAPQSGLADLAALAEQVGGAGLPVSVHTEGRPRRLPHALDVSAYRIVQEGLTNALRHAGASRADVTVRYGPGELGLEVRDDGAGGSAGDGGGYGLAGIRERVKIYGGEMTAGPADAGGFVLRARLPVREGGS